jgi:hypothetical protein
MCYDGSSPRMPRKTEWIHRLDAALAGLEALPCPVVDAALLAELLEITPRHARRVLGRLFEQPAGRGFVALRSDLIERLQALQADPDHQIEVRRRDRVDAHLAAVRRDWKARQVVIEAPARMSAGIAGLPEGVHLEAGRLEIRFETPAELLTHLVSLAQAISEDFDRFAELGS